MSNGLKRLLIGGTAAAAALAWIAVNLGPTEALLVGVLLGLLTATAWMPGRIVRLVGSVYLAFVVGIFGRVAWGLGGGVVLALVVGALAWRFVGTQVQRRVAFLIPSMVLLIFVTSTLMYWAPGSPFAQERATTQQALKAQQARFKIEDTATKFFFSYMKGIVTEGTMGESVKVQGRTVEELLLPALPVSMSLGILALTLAVALGLFMGVRAGLRPNSAADYSSMAIAMIGISLPNFVIGAGFMLLLSLSFGWLPVAGWGTYPHLIMPALTLALPYAAYIARLARGGTIEVMQQDFIRTARAKGLSERAVVLGTAIIYFTIITMFNLLVDIAYAWLDPRVREEI